MTVSLGIVLRIRSVGTVSVTEQPAALMARGRPSACEAGDALSVGLSEAA